MEALPGGGLLLNMDYTKSIKMVLLK